MYVSAGFEKKTLEELIETTAMFHVNAYNFEDEEYVMLPDESYLSPGELCDFNDTVRARIEELEEDAYRNRSAGQIAWDRGCDEYHSGRDA